MTDPDVQAAFLQIDERWDERRARSGLERAQRALQRRRTRRAALAGASALAALALLVWAAERRTPQLPAAPEALTLADGSQILLLDARSRVDVTEDTRFATRATLVRGRARFDVVPRHERVFAVQSGGVGVRVLGTRFELERAAERTRVSVLRGRVAVTSGAAERELTAGESDWFSPAGEPQLAAAPSAPAPQPTAAPLGSEEGPRTAAHLARQPSEASTAHAHRSAQPRPTAQKPDEAPAAASGWRESAARGEYARAYALLQQPEAEPGTVDELLLAADAARLSGHPAAALPFLERVVREHAQDARASLAAFTLGGVLMQQLDRPREAQAAYAQARALALHASLAQDALARQVEAAQRAGDAAQARALAREYLSRYPTGRRVHAVRRFAGLDAE
jgi:transmembrane sensor